MALIPAWRYCPKRRASDGACGGCTESYEIVLHKAVAYYQEEDAVVISDIVEHAERAVVQHELKVRRPFVVHKSTMLDLHTRRWSVTALPQTVMCPCSNREHEVYGKTVWRAIETGEWCGNPGQPWTSGDGQQHEDGWCDECIDKRCPHCDE